MSRHTVADGRRTWEDLARSLHNETEVIKREPRHAAPSAEDTQPLYLGHAQYQEPRSHVANEGPRWFIIFPLWIMVVFAPFVLAINLIKLGFMFIGWLGRWSYKIISRFYTSRLPVWIKVVVTILFLLFFVSFASAGGGGGH